MVSKTGGELIDDMHAKILKCRHDPVEIQLFTGVEKQKRNSTADHSWSLKGL